LFVVADVGGTTLRIGCMDRATGRLFAVRREPVQGIARFPNAPVGTSQQRVVAQLQRLVGELIRDAGNAIAAVGIAFAGPINAAGEVTDAPTIWGPRGEPVPLVELLQTGLEPSVHVLNDVTAAGWRYLAEEDEDFCVVTVSSGIGNKVFRHGEVLLHPDGMGGEIGHVRVDYSPTAQRCDCGGGGHLGAIASGRGLLAGVRARAAAQPQAFRRSVLYDEAAGKPCRITDRAVAKAIREDDPFTLAVFRHGITCLAGVLATIHAAVGVRRFIIIGGLALAIGERYLDHLADRLQYVGCFGITSHAIPAMLRLGEPDDNHGLIGCGRFLEQCLMPAGTTVAQQVGGSLNQGAGMLQQGRR